MRVVVALTLALGLVPARLVAQGDTLLYHAMALEDDGKLAEAAASYRQAAHGESLVPAILGLERVYSDLGVTDSMRTLLDSAIAALPDESVLRTVQLRVLRAGGHTAETQAAFEKWVARNPRDVTPYREYARLLLERGELAHADSVILRAGVGVGASPELAADVAAIRAAMGQWANAAESWRTAMAGGAATVQGAVFSLTQTPVAQRAAVREALLADPPVPAARATYAGLALGWGLQSEAWMALRDLRPDSAGVAAWTDFAERAEAAEAWGNARDALQAVMRAHPDPETAARAAGDAMRAGDAQSALLLATTASARLDSSRAARDLAPMRIRALAQLGRPGDAATVLHAYDRFFDDATRAAMLRVVAWGWVRAGNVEAARVALATVGDTTEDDAPVLGWLSLYQGDLRNAREHFRESVDPGTDVIEAQALLARTTAERSAETGNAFLALARGDSVRAAASFEAAARNLPDAAPLLLSMAARIDLARHDDASAFRLLVAVVSEYEQAPEAPNADLELARVLRRRGDIPAATARLEHLILTYPESALVPQARRELDATKNSAVTP